jgi:hypothetical protein
MITDNIKTWINKNVHFLVGCEIRSYNEQPENIIRLVEENLIDSLKSGIKKKMKVTKLEHPLKISERYHGEVFIFSAEELKELLELHEKEIKKNDGYETLDEFNNYIKGMRQDPDGLTVIMKDDFEILVDANIKTHVKSHIDFMENKLKGDK